MKRWKSAGLWLAVFACAGLAGWGGRQWEAGKAREAAQDAVTPTPPRARVHMPISMSPGQVRTTAFPLTREAAQRAARAGVLRVALADGTYYDVQIAHESIDAQGHWSISGHARTALGPQAMVLTYGERAVFGTLPLPDGRVLQVRTEHGRPLIGDHLNFVMPRSTANKRENFAPPKTEQTTPPPSLDTTGPGAMLVGDTVAISVLGTYTDELLTSRDNDLDAIATEFASMLAIANQAHLDSDSIVRFENAGLRAVGADFADNASALQDLRTNTGVRDARNEIGADLVVLLRSRGKRDTDCGAAIRAAEDQARFLTDKNGFAVVDVAPCGPYTLAHELGHTLGNAHDRDSELSEAGELRSGAYPYSFAHKTRTFATLDAEAGDLPVVGRFSNPRQLDCDGAACGIEDRADNVRSMALMAAEVSQYRGTPGTLSIADAVAYEPEIHPGMQQVVRIPIRITGVATDEIVTVVATGGTATPGVDYGEILYLHNRTFRDPSEAFVEVILFGDDEDEGDETVELQIVEMDTTGTTTIERATATLTIVDRARETLSGRVRLDGVANLGYRVDLVAYGANGDGKTEDITYISAFAPDFEFSLPVRRSANVRLELPWSVQWFAAPVYVNEMHGTRYVELTVQNRVPVIVHYPPNGDGFVRYTQTVGHLPAESGILPTSGQSFSQLDVPPGARVRLDVDIASQGSHGRVFEDVRAPIDFDATVSNTPSAYVDAARRTVNEGSDGETRTANFVVRLSAPSAERASLHYRTVGGTADAGSDFIGVEGDLAFEPGETSFEVPVTILGDETFEYPEFFELLIEDASGAVPTTARLKMVIADDDLARGGPSPAGAH